MSADGRNGGRREESVQGRATMLKDKTTGGGMIRYGSMGCAHGNGFSRAVIVAVLAPSLAWLGGCA